MSTESKPLSTGKAAVATTGWGAILSLVAGQSSQIRTTLGER